jgi:hypothetical protein
MYCFDGHTTARAVEFGLKCAIYKIAIKRRCLLNLVSDIKGGT